MQVGDTFQINAYVEPDDANDQSVLYRSSKQEIAEVQQMGIVTAKQIGETEIITSAKDRKSVV